MRKTIIAVLILAAFVCGASCAGDSTKRPHQHQGGQAGREEPRREKTNAPGENLDPDIAKKPEGKSQDPGIAKEPEQVPTSQVEGDARAYYNAAAARDYDYTYEHLTSLDQAVFSRSEWVEVNEVLQSDQGTYEIQDIRKDGRERFAVELLVSGSPRTTYFVSDEEAGAYEHELTGEEYTMFTNALSSASASASVSASAAPSGSSDTTVTVVDVVDGDTFDIDRSVQGMDRVRLIGVDTPEVYGGEEPCGQEASDFTTQELEGQEVSLEIGEDPEDPYGRLLAYVFRDGEFFNETLVYEGLARAESYPPNTKYDERLEAAEAAAQTPLCSDDASASAGASASASASASPAPEDSGGGSTSKLNNGVDDVNCSDLSGPVAVGNDDEDNLDA